MATLSVGSERHQAQSCCADGRMGFILGAKATDGDLAPTDRQVSLPSLTALTPRDAPVARRRASMAGRVLHVPTVGCLTEISSSVIESIAINVVNLNIVIRTEAQQLAMHLVGAKAGPWKMLATPSVTTVEIPTISTGPLSIDSIDQGMPANSAAFTEQRHPGNVTFNDRAATRATVLMPVDIPERLSFEDATLPVVLKRDRRRLPTAALAQCRGARKVIIRTHPEPPTRVAMPRTVDAVPGLCMSKLYPMSPYGDRSRLMRMRKVVETSQR